KLETTSCYASAVYNQRLASHERCHWGSQKKCCVGNILGFSSPPEWVGCRVLILDGDSRLKLARLSVSGSGSVDSIRRYGVYPNLKSPSSKAKTRGSWIIPALEAA